MLGVVDAMTHVVQLCEPAVRTAAMQWQCSLCAVSNSVTARSRPPQGQQQLRRQHALVQGLALTAHVVHWNLAWLLAGHKRVLAALHSPCYRGEAPLSPSSKRPCTVEMLVLGQMLLTVRCKPVLFLVLLSTPDPGTKSGSLHAGRLRLRAHRTHIVARMDLRLTSVYVSLSTLLLFQKLHRALENSKVAAQVLELECHPRCVLRSIRIIELFEPAHKCIAVSCAACDWRADKAPVDETMCLRTTRATHP